MYEYLPHCLGSHIKLSSISFWSWNTNCGWKTPQQCLFTDLYLLSTACDAEIKCLYIQGNKKYERCLSGFDFIVPFFKIVINVIGSSELPWYREGKGKVTV